MNKENIKNKKWNWKYSEIVDSKLSENEISDIINYKLARIIIELEHNPINLKINQNKKEIVYNNAKRRYN